MVQMVPLIQGKSGARRDPVLSRISQRISKAAVPAGAAGRP